MEQHFHQLYQKEFAMLSLIVAIDKNNGIGLGKNIPWAGKTPRDMRYFKEITMGHPVIMGRATWESLPLQFRPLPGRLNIILSHHPHFQVADAMVCNNLARAINVCNDSAPAKEIFIIGGAKVYKEAFLLVDRMYITLVDGEFLADKYFPKWEEEDWDIVKNDVYPPDEKNLKLTFMVLDRKP